MMFMLCTAWPLAPLTRLSSALITMSRPVRGSSRHAISMTFVPDDIFCVGQRFAFEQTDERFVAVKLFVAGGNFFFGQFFRRLKIKRRQNAAIDRNQMRRELDDRLAIWPRAKVVPRFPTNAGASARRKGGRFRCIRKKDNPASALRPAPLTPLKESAMMPVGLIRPAFSSGIIGSKMLVG